ncbi:hypothetical protein [Thermocatellispora tengchongensis]|uniref:hypothetical protein n=1 Tax=Thermocatellispora tengchongensis TaxID=1073253 RepID=UPI0036276744
MAAGVFGLMKFSWIFWWAGKLWGERIVRYFLGSAEGRKARLLLNRDPSKNWLVWAAVLLAHLPFVPSALAYAAAGWARMRLATFLVLHLSASLAWAGSSPASGIHSAGRGSIWRRPSRTMPCGFPWARSW